MRDAPVTMAETIARLGGHDRTKCVRCICLRLNGPHPVAECCPPPTSAPWLPSQLQRMYAAGDRNGIVAGFSAKIRAELRAEDPAAPGELAILPAGRNPAYVPQTRQTLPLVAANVSADDRCPDCAHPLDVDCGCLCCG